ncbi:translation initiation factor IF3-2, chloroplastic-like [Henckelia pumila]|uniref:translation initiation factor IF3-2, chloroplastic-like n=1 Tax=Henckelia pumila TaxID=405737 RepID=UPI003C6E3EDF
MAGLTSSFAPLFKNPQLSQSHKPLSLQSCTFYFRLNNATWPSTCTSKSTVSARYGGDVSSRRSKANVDEALNISSIGSSTVRLIDEQQKMVGLVSKAQALQMADAAELDLVILSADADPPVVRIMDYNKYRYEQQKKKRDQQKKSAAGRMDLKELKMGYNIDVHDYSVRLRAAQKFLKDGDKVKVIVSLKGRENEFRNNAIELIKRFQNDVGESAIEESKNFRERNIYIILVPNKAVVVQKSPEQPKKKDDTAATEVSAGV